MKRAWNEFWKDYNDMCIAPQNKWLKKHWKGYILMLIGSFVGGYGIGWSIDKIGDKISERKYRKYYEE